MIRKTRTGALIAAVVVTLAAGAAWAQSPAPPGTPPPAGSGGMHRGPGAWLQQKLGLSDDQAKAIREVHQQQAEARKRQMAALHQAQQDLRRLALNGADDATLRAKQTDVTNLLAEGVRLRTEMLKQVGPILTPEQRQKLADLGDRMPRGRHMRHRGPAV